jgi:hypothetical protein
LVNLGLISDPIFPFFAFFPTSTPVFPSNESRGRTIAHRQQELKPRNWAPEVTGFGGFVQLVDLAFNPVPALLKSIPDPPVSTPLSVLTSLYSPHCTHLTVLTSLYSGDSEGKGECADGWLNPMAGMLVISAANLKIINSGAQ